MENVYRTALDILRDKGWCKGELTDQNGGHCAIGAILAQNEDEEKWTSTLAQIVMDQYPDRVDLGCAEGHGERWVNWETVASFNNHSDTTFADVERVFEKGALRVDEVVV